jgi:hypothetical protein
MLQILALAIILLPAAIVLAKAIQWFNEGF